MDLKARFVSRFDKVLYGRGVRSAHQALRGPDSVLIEITNRCSFSCLGCEFHDEQAPRAYEENTRIDMDPVLFKKIILQARQLKVREIVITAQGEPFLHPEILEMIKFVKLNKLRCHIITNGLHLDKSTLRLLNGLEVDRISLSVWTLDKDAYAYLHRRRDSSDLEAISDMLRYKRLKNFKYPLMVGVFVVYKDNYRQLFKIIEESRRFGFDRTKFKLFRLDYSRPSGQELLLSGADLQDCISCYKNRAGREGKGSLSNIKNFLRLLETLEVKNGTYHTPRMPCYIGWLHLVIRLNGDIVPCCRTVNHVMGNVSRDALRDIFFSSDYDRFRNKLSIQRSQGTSHVVCEGLCPDFNLNFSFFD